MMQSIIISPSSISSPRWKQAFPDAMLLTCSHDLKDQPLNDAIIWLVMTEDFDFLAIPQWVKRGARIVALTQHEDSSQAKYVLELGASGYLHYLASVPVLEQAYHVVEVGGLWLGADLMRQLVFATSRLIQPAPNRLFLGALSLREQDVAKAVASGKTNKEVARDLAITERTVKAHLSSVFEKLQVRDRLHLVLVIAGQ